MCFINNLHKKYIRVRGNGKEKIALHFPWHRPQDIFSFLFSSTFSVAPTEVSVAADNHNKTNLLPFLVLGVDVGKSSAV